MSKVIYKVIDNRGRLTLPPEFRKYLGLKGGDIVRLESDNEKIQLKVTKMDIVDLASQDVDAMATYVTAAIKQMPAAMRTALAAQCLAYLNTEE